VEYRIFTQYFPDLHNTISSRIDDFTLLKGTGYWKGGQEYSAFVIIRVDTADPEEYDRIDTAIPGVIKDILVKHHQEAVLLTEHDLEWDKSMLITRQSWGLPTLPQLLQSTRTRPSQ
jgi:hypothetical protein